MCRRSCTRVADPTRCATSSISSAATSRFSPATNAKDNSTLSKSRYICSTSPSLVPSMLHSANFFCIASMSL